MKYCPECGKPNYSDAKFCYVCGAKFPAFSIIPEAEENAPDHACGAQVPCNPSDTVSRFRYWIPWVIIAVSTPLLCIIAFILNK